MLKRRTFVAYSTGLAASLFAVNKLWRNTAAETDLTVKPAGPSLPAHLNQSKQGLVNAPPIVESYTSRKPAVDLVAEGRTGISAGETIQSSANTRDLPDSDQKAILNPEEKPLQIADRHLDNIILDNIPDQTQPANPLVEDVMVSEDQKMVFKSALSRLSRLQDYVGYGNFNIIDLDQSLRLAKNNDQISAFTGPELEYIEELFFTESSRLGFYGDKIITGLSSSIVKKDIVRLPGSGHYLFRGAAFNTFQKIRRDIGDTIILTSGIRSVVKQLYLFLDKTDRVNGNLSLASYSLAPPGHSYHAVGDFDIGKKGFGRKNFTDEFANTDEFKRLSDLGYLNIRYPQNNPYGVRYEPWHIKVV